MAVLTGRAITSQAGAKVEGSTEIRSANCEKCHILLEVIEHKEDMIPDVRRCPKCGGDVGELLVAFNSKDAEGYWRTQYQRERIIYSMKHRRHKIAMYLRTGDRSLRLRIFGVRFEAKRLQRINQKEAT